jgi:hypothetical protein
VPLNTYATAAMNARQMLEVLGAMNLRALLNRSCATGCFTMPANLMRDLASGVALQPQPIGSEPQELTLQMIDPADYPTDLIQPLFESLRKHREFRAAWVMQRQETAAAGGRHYQVMLLMDPRDEVLVHDFNMVLTAACHEPDAVSFALMNEEDAAYTRSLFALAQPFYRAADFVQES